MAINSAISYTATNGSLSFSGIQSTNSGNNGIDISVEVPANTTNQLYAITVDVSEVQSVFINTDGALTLKTNSTGSPAQTLTFAANYPMQWASGMPTSNPLNTDVTAFYFTNGTNATVTVSGFIVQDL